MGTRSGLILRSAYPGQRSAVAAEDTAPGVIHCARFEGLCDRFPGRPWLVEAGNEGDGTYDLDGYASEDEARAVAATLAEPPPHEAR